VLEPGALRRHGWEFDFGFAGFSTMTNWSSGNGCCGIPDDRDNEALTEFG
jgi:hypothetical protein